MTATKITTEELRAYAERQATRARRTAGPARVEAARLLQDPRYTLASVEAALQEAAKHEAAAELLELVARFATAADTTPVDVALWVAQRLSAGPQDGSSGYGNDLRRVQFEGVRDAAGRVLDAIRYGA